MNQDSSIYVAGGHGMVGRAVVRELLKAGYRNVRCHTRQDCDLRDPSAVRDLLYSEEPEYLFLTAAVVGGIEANAARPVDFLLDNLQIQNNVISRAAQMPGLRKLLFLGSSCVYPKLAPQPIAESSLLTSALEPTNEWYAVAKIAGLKLCQAYRRQYGKHFISAMPTNLYGPADNYDPAESHVIPALIRRFHEARRTYGPVEVWGSPRTRREFLYVDDLARALIRLMEVYEDDRWINVGSGSDISMGELSRKVADVVEIDPERIVFNPDRPTGTPRKLLHSRNIFNLGWRPTVDLWAGLRRSYLDFLARHEA